MYVQGDQFGCLRHELRWNLSTLHTLSEGDKYIWFLLYQYVHDKPWQMSGRYAKTMNFKSNLTGYYFTTVVGHTTQLIGNGLLSSCYPELCSMIASSELLRVSNMYECFCPWAYIWAFRHIEHNAYILFQHEYFEHVLPKCPNILSMMFRHFSHNIYVSAFCTIAQCICVFWTQQVLYSRDTILLTLESQIFARKSSNQDFRKGTI